MPKSMSETDTKSMTAEMLRKMADLIESGGVYEIEFASQLPYQNLNGDVLGRRYVVQVIDRGETKRT